MDPSILISALSLFAGASLLPAGLLVLRDRDIPVDRQHHVRGTMAILIALVLLACGILFLLDVVAQDVTLLLASFVLVIVLPLAMIRLDSIRQK